MAAQQQVEREAGEHSAEADLARVLGAFGVGTAEELVKLARQTRPGWGIEGSGPADEGMITLSTRCARAEREVRVLRALLLMKNVEVGTQALGAVGADFAPDLGEGGNGGGEDGSRPAEVGSAGGGGVAEELLRLRAKVKLLQQSCLVLRAEVVYLREAIPTTTRWVVDKAHAALANEVRQRRVLQNRIASLAKLLQ